MVLGLGHRTTVRATIAAEVELIVSVVVAPSAADLKLVKRQEGESVVENRRNPKNPLKDLFLVEVLLILIIQLISFKYIAKICFFLKSSSST